ncbi:MAG: hypothetical protein ISS19_12075 [Bacteroidales bacterium]|nr:hypothetical protein [Bacteroidales bacterium]
MQKEDYILREIEKIGMMLQMIIKKLIVKQEKLPIQFDYELKEANEMFREIGFEMDEFLQLDHSAIEDYLMKIDGMRGPNIELLGDLLKEMGMRTGPDLRQAYLEKALNLYELCNSQDRTFSIERESKINNIKNMLA